MTTATATPNRPSARNARLVSLVQDALLVTLSLLAAYAHGTAVLTEGRYSSLPFAAEQSLLVGLFLSRRRSRVTSSNPWDWVVAAGGWLPLLMRPAQGPDALALSGTAIQVAGLCLTVVAMGYLGRSFGVVAANRGLKRNGAYRIVRHPIYLGHTITKSGFVLANPSGLNIVLAAAITFFHLLRIRAEERLLTETDEYAEYAARVRWRLIPGLY